MLTSLHQLICLSLQEGMVFVSMTSDDIFNRTAQYQIQYPESQQRRSQRTNELPPIVSIRHHDDGTMTAAQARARRLYEIGRRDDEESERTALLPADFTMNAQPFNVTATCSESDGEEADDLVRARRRRIQHRLAGRHEDSDSSEEENPLRPEQLNPWAEDFVPVSRSTGFGPLRRHETMDNITLAQAAEASQIATQEAVRAVGGELMAPLTQFNIERDKSKCTLKFDPPVSARFILLKLWSPHSNIDIQYVVAKGFAGPRYFPAVTMR